MKKWKNVYEESLKDSNLYRKGMEPLFTLLVQLWYPFPLEDGRNWKKCAVVKNNFSHWAIQICQNQDSISSPLSGKNMITFWTIWAILGKKQGGVTRQSVRIKIGHILFYPHDSWSTSYKKNLVPSFSSFTIIHHKGHFRNILTWIFKFGCFPWYHNYIY